MKRHVMILGWVLLVPLMGFSISPAHASDQSVCYQLSGRQSVDACTRVIETWGWSGANLSSAYTARGVTYHVMGRYRKAIRDFNKAIQLDPGDGAIYYNRARSNEDLGRYRRALSDVQKAIALDGPVSYYPSALERIRGLAAQQAAPAPAATAPPPAKPPLSSGGASCGGKGC